MVSSKRLAWLFTAVAFALAAWPGIEALSAGRAVSYDAGLAVLTATLITIIWYTHFTYEAVEASRESAEATRKLAQLQEARTEAHGSWLAQRLAEHMYRLGSQAVIWRWYDEESHEEKSHLKEEGLLAGSRQEETTIFLEDLEEDLDEMVEGAKVGYPRAAGILSSDLLRRKIREAKFQMPQLGESYGDFGGRMERFTGAMDEIADMIGGATREVSERHHDWAMSIIRQLEEALQEETESSQH